jgi:hypothetical protein
MSRHPALADLEEAAQHYVAAMDALEEMNEALARARVLIEQPPTRAKPRYSTAERRNWRQVAKAALKK